MFKKVLIANRGAIACRIIRTLTRMGVGSVAVYSEADRHSMHVAQASEAVAIGPSPAAQSYLRVEAILEAARATGAEAIHPGYGFLSENPDFAEACAEAGIVFIGPKPDQMRAFGLKHKARELALQAGVPLAPGSGLIDSLSDAQREAARIGYPVMLKSTAGGGGIGLQLVSSAEELAPLYERVERLARNNFKNPGLFLEKYVARGRHIEVQIFGDGKGRVIALGERDCSAQRRNQKVIEETPAPGLPETTRAALWKTACDLGRSVTYESAGTVEFLYDSDTDAFYFLEVNTRLQVEHGVTEEVTGLDLVEWMVRQAAGEALPLDQAAIRPKGASIQVRLYAEDPGRDFRPSSGQLSHVAWPAGARVETWVESGAEVSPFYDPMLAKIIVAADTREAALAKLRDALSRTEIGGLETNLDYLRQLAASQVLARGEMLTRTLATFPYDARTIEVLAGGTQTTIQDWPGRIGYWAVGVPPSGPMDALSFRLANRLVGNAEGAPGLELTLSGPTLQFNCDAVICLAGAEMTAAIGGRAVPFWQPVSVAKGEVLKIGSVTGAGARAYLAVAGGFDVPAYLGSRATFTLGKFGGHGGRALLAGDVLHVGAAGVAAGEQCSAPSPCPSPHRGEGTQAEASPCASPRSGGGLSRSERGEGTQAEASPSATPRSGEGTQAEPSPSASPRWGEAATRSGAGEGAPLAAALRPEMTRAWEVGVLYGPHGAPDFFTEGDIAQFFGADWEVHYNSNRTGVRLIGPKPTWARADGGEAGLHPSNIHDNAYAIGAVDFTGDMPVILGPDGPSLGGFVCPVTIVAAELWKLGQLRPGDKVRFKRLSPAEARAAELRQDHQVATLALPAQPALVDINRLGADDSIVGLRPQQGTLPRVVYRRAGDKYLLVEYGPIVLDFELRFRAHVLMTRLAALALPGIIDLTPGIRSLQVHYDSRVLALESLIDALARIEDAMGDIGDIEVPSRIVHMPLSWDDAATQAAITKYMQSVRADAPWCPSNIEFIRRINGLASVEDVRRIAYGASYLVLGLGDVYLGAPVATPVDPRHRLVTTKYNPARTWTPENAVGIGGAYLCIYGMEGPGGYQFIGRTAQVWNTYRVTREFDAEKPWLLRFFDQIRFYPVSAEELLAFRDGFLQGKVGLKIEPTLFKLSDYRRFLADNADDIRAFKACQQAAFEAERSRWQASDQSGAAVADTGGEAAAEDELAENAIAVASPVPGAVWKVEVKAGARVKEGDLLVVVESMKMEMAVHAPSGGVVADVRCAEGKAVALGQTLVVLIDEGSEAAQ